MLPSTHCIIRLWIVNTDASVLLHWLITITPVQVDIGLLKCLREYDKAGILISTVLFNDGFLKACFQSKRINIFRHFWTKAKLWFLNIKTKLRAFFTDGC